MKFKLREFTFAETKINNEHNYGGSPYFLSALFAIFRRFYRISLSMIIGKSYKPQQLHVSLSV